MVVKQAARVGKSGCEVGRAIAAIAVFRVSMTRCMDVLPKRHTDIAVEIPILSLMLVAEITQAGRLLTR